MVSQKMKKVRFRTQLLSSGCTVLESMLRRKSRKACFSNSTELKKKIEEKKSFLYPAFSPVDVQYLKVRYEENLEKLAFRTRLS